MKEFIDIRNLELGSVYPMLCAQCGTTHYLISSYNEKIARANYRAIRDCPVCSKKRKEKRCDHQELPQSH